MPAPIKTQQAVSSQSNGKAVVSKNPLLAKLGPKAADAVAKHADETTTVVAYINLPPGIMNGVAQLTEMYFSEYKTGENKGKIFWRAAGNVFAPEEATCLIDGHMEPGQKMRVRGLQTSLMIGPIEDTVIQNGKRAGEVKTVDEFIDEIMRNIRALGGDTTGATLDDLEGIGNALVEAAPFFKFITEPRIAQADQPMKKIKKGDITGAWERWLGIEGVENYEPNPIKKVGQDNTGTVSPPVSPPASTTNRAATTNGKPTAQSPLPPPPPPPVEPDNTPFIPETSEDLDMLLADAISDSDTSADSQARIIELGVEAGANQAELEGANSWEDTVAMVQSAQLGEGDENNEPVTQFVVGQVVGYHPKNPKTKKPVKDPVKATIKAVHDNDTVDLESGKAKFKGVETSELVAAPD